MGTGLVVPLAGSAALDSGRGLATGAGVGVGSTCGAGAVVVAAAAGLVVCAAGLVSVVEAEGAPLVVVLLDGLPLPEPVSGVPLPCALK